jgi:hypothetical protein
MLVRGLFYYRKLFHGLHSPFEFPELLRKKAGCGRCFDLKGE